MVPTLAPGERLLARAARRYRPGDLVVVRRPERLIVKRLVRVDADGCWVEGNIDASDDSRAFGPVPPDAILGRVVWRYWPRPGRVR